ncbi:hypothetical protein [Phytoactinopolyspora limicola]|uniref:hypothetical protein n=1 Tax=Phytoactinopolyspora limicola TaxID=2715536 RepID=UPI001A9C6B0A|nr:hypothetical protein [Phytoactinopolyspora limicola]
MNTAARPTTSGVVATVWLGVIFLLGNAFTTFMIIDSWGGTYWRFNLAVGVVVCSLALMRTRYPMTTAAAGLAVAATAVVVSWAAELPREPGPITALALSVLVASAIRRLPAQPAAALTLGGLAVVAGAWAADPGNPVVVLAAMGWIGAVVIGPALRYVDRSQHRTAPDGRTAGRRQGSTSSR